MSRIKGFTIPELIVVIAVIGILASIVIVNYNGVQKRGQDAAVQSDLQGAIDLLEGYRTRSTPRNFPSTASNFTDLSIKASKSNYKTTIPANFIYCVNSSDYQSYTLTAESKSGAIFSVNQDGFVSQSYVESDLTSSFCSTKFGAGWTQINGMAPANTWSSWVGS